MQAPVSASGAEQVAAAADKAGEEKQPSELLQGELTGQVSQSKALPMDFLVQRSQTSALQITDAVCTTPAKMTIATRSLMNSWIKFCEQRPELLSASSSSQHPCAYQDEVIRDSQASSSAGEEGEGLRAQQEKALFRVKLLV